MPRRDPAIHGASFLNEGIRLMLEALRNGAKSWAAKMLLALSAGVRRLGYSVMSFSGFQTAGPGQQSVASSISCETFRQDLNRTLQQFSQQSGTNCSH